MYQGVMVRNITKKTKGGEMHQDRKINSFIKGDAWSISRNHQGEEKK